MRIGILREIKAHECQVSATPERVREFVAHGHTVLADDPHRANGLNVQGGRLVHRAVAQAPGAA